MNTQTEISTYYEDEVDILDEVSHQYQLIVWNDDINTFDWVIKALVEICKHEPEQAEQCSLLIHFKGKCTVKSGEYDLMKSMHTGITDRGIHASIEELVN